MILQGEKPIQIGELSRITGTSIRMIRYFDKHGLISVAARKPRGYRLFNQTHVAEIQWVKRMQDLGFSLAEISKTRDIECGTMTDIEKEQALEVIFSNRLKTLESQIGVLQGIRRQLKKWQRLRLPR
jgi:DNA-binding transcriptional MerR regulator